MRHERHQRLVVAVTVAVVWMLAPRPDAQQAVDPEHRRIYNAYRAWQQQQPRDVQGASDVVERYGASLKAVGLADAEVARRLQIVRDMLRRSVDIWNEALTAPNPTFNVKPNAFLVEMTKGLRPGRALDVGMGQGRNAIYLAQQGWDVTGFDPADRAVAAANATAKTLGLTLKTFVTTTEQFDFGTAQWDLIVFTYVAVRGSAKAAVDALRPGGLVVVENFHRDIFRGQPREEAELLFGANELLTLFSGLRIRRYEDTEAPTDYGRRPTTAVVRLAAQKE